MCQKGGEYTCCVVMQFLMACVEQIEPAAIIENMILKFQVSDMWW